MYPYRHITPVNFWDPTGKYKEGDEKYSQEAREGIDIYGQIWLDAEAAYSLGIISEGEKKSIQTTVEDAADAIRESEDHPWKTFGRNVLEFALFDVVLGDFSHTTVYAADLSGLAFDKMYNNESNFSAIVAVAGVASYNKGRTLVNTKINGKMTRVDIEFPQGNKPGNLHVQIKGTDTKVMINSLDDIGNLPKSVRNNTKVINAIKKGLKLLQKLI